MRGVGFTWTQFEQATFWSIKPFVGLTHWNIEVYYAYYGILSKNKNLNRHSFNLGYRINF